MSTTATSTDAGSSLLWKCPICLDTLERPVLTTCCGQSFCDACLNTALAKVDACPMCREPLLAGAHSATRNRALEDILAQLPASVREHELTSRAVTTDSSCDRAVLIDIDSSDTRSDDDDRLATAPATWHQRIRNMWLRAFTALTRYRILYRTHSSTSTSRSSSLCTSNAVQLRQWRHWCRVHWSTLQCIFYVVLFFVFVSFLRIQEDEFAEHA